MTLKRWTSPQLRTVVRRVAGLVLLTSTWLTSGSGLALAGEPDEWIDRMIEANQTYSFRGTLVHMCGGAVDVMQITHRVHQGVVTERITSQDIGGRQIVRTDREVMCILPDQKKVVVTDPADNLSPLADHIANFPSFADVSSALYKTQIAGTGRVAGQDTIILAVVPADAHRFGYQLWLARDTALPMKIALVDAAGNALEQSMFTKIHVAMTLAPSEVEPTIATEGFERQEVQKIDAPVNDSQFVWHATDLPAGFELMSAQMEMSDEGGEPVEHLVYSDGLAAVSVFVEKMKTDSREADNASHFGATNAYSLSHSGHLVTAMGGVPVATAQMIAMSVERRAGD